MGVFGAVAWLIAPRGRRSRLLLWSTAVFVVATAVLAPVLIANVSSWTRLTALSHTAGWWLLTQMASLPALAAIAMFVAFTLRLRSGAGVSRRA
jgi:hypothetical protein